MATRTPLNQLARYHRETLLDQIAILHQQIDINLEKRESIRHLKDLIAERENYLSQFGQSGSGVSTRDPAAKAYHPPSYKG
jgi:hypothetical protein